MPLRSPSRTRCPGSPRLAPLLLTLTLGCAAPEAEREPAGDAANSTPAAPDTAPAAGSPSTDIWIAPLEGSGPDLRLGPARNATDRPGYDNQPAFAAPDRLLYTRDEDGDADVWQLDPGGGAPTPVTTTSPESEYSATPLPWSQGISVIRVEADSTQRLWQIDGNGTPVAPIFPDLAPVGYHAWLDDTHALLFVLGHPPTLHLATRGESETRVVASDVGRSIQALPGGGEVSWVQRTGENATEIRVWSLADGDSRRIADGVEGGDDHAWTPDGLLLQAAGNRVYALDPEGDRRWREIGALATGTTVTRMAVSPDGRVVALVVGGP